METILALCDGFLFPGSHSNVAPHHYNASHTETKKDEARDELSLNIIRQAIDKNIPCLGICRGFQEMNVALGGTLNPAVHDAGFNDHREAQVEDFEEKYAPAH
ncbi:glutamine amidotransferase, partial [Vibrio xuii]